MDPIMRLMPGDIRLVDEIMFELKSKGIFDTFRKDCIADVDTRPAYQNLRQRVESSVHNFLSRQTWVPEMNKNQMREKLRKHIMDGNYLEQGVERIVDQVVNPKVNTIFKPQIEDLVYSYYGVPRPKKAEEDIIDLTENLLPNDLEAVSPGSVTNEEKDADVTMHDECLTEKMDEDKENMKIPEHGKSPTFEPVCNSQKILLPDEPEPLPGIIDLTINEVESSDNPINIPLPGEVKVEDIPPPANTPPDINVQNIQLPEEPSAVEIYNIPLPDEVPPKTPENNDDYHFRPIDSDEDSISSCDSSLRRNMSPLTPIRNFDNDNSYDAQQAFETSESPEKKDKNLADVIVPISTFRFTIESKDSESSNDGVTKSKKTIAVSSYKTGKEIKTFSSPLLQAFGDSSNSNNLHIDYESDNSKVVNDTKLTLEGDQNSESVDIAKKDTKTEEKRSHKSSHSSRDRHRDNKERKSDSKHSSSKDKKDSKSDKKSSRDNSKSKSHRDNSKESDRKDSKSKDTSRHTSSHKSSSSKEKSSSHRHSSSSSKQTDDKKTDDKKSSSNKEKSDKRSDSKNSKDSKSSRDHKSKDRKSSSSRNKNSDDKDSKKDKRSSDDHYSLSGRGNHSRRSTDRDSNDGNSSSSKGSNINSSSKTNTDKKSKSSSTSKSGSTSSSSETTAQSDSVENTNNNIDEKKCIKINGNISTIPPVRVDSHLGIPICEVPKQNHENEVSLVPNRKPKFASNFEEAKKLMKLRDIMNAEERKKKQDAALLLEFQQNVRPSLSQVYSNISGPELEFACSANSNNYSVQVNVEPIMENVSNEAIEENNANELNAKVIEQHVGSSRLNTLVNAMIEVNGINNENSAEVDNNVTQNISQINGEQVILFENETKTKIDNDLEANKHIVIKTDIKTEKSDNPKTESSNEFHYFSEVDKFVAEIERDTFSIFLKELTDTVNKSRLYLINCDENSKKIVEEMSSTFGDYEVVNLTRNENVVINKIKTVKDVEVNNKEVTLPVSNEKEELFSPIKCEEIDYFQERNKIKSEVKTKQEIMEIIFGVPSDSPSKLPNVNLGDECLIWNGDKRGVKRKLSMENDNNNKDVLSPIKIHLNNDCEQITSTATDTELRSNNEKVNNAHAKYIGRAQRVGLPKPKRISLPISPSSVENYENTPKTTEPIENGKIKPKKSYIQRYERSDLYKPKLHYLSKRNMT